MWFHSALILYSLLPITWSITMFPGDTIPLPPCEICKTVAEKFVEGYKKTARSNFGGGNTDWEERKLKEYGKSETRFIEVTESICKNTDSQCSSFLEQYEEEIETWWQTGSLESVDNFFQWLCIDETEVCCPAGTFGKNCRKCQYGDNGRVCSGNGECDGDGRRSGNGRCICAQKYTGTNCSNCRSGFEKSIGADNEVICSDIDECHSNILLSPCLLYKCNNTEGGYECYGEPFFHDVRKLATLAVLIITAGILSFKDMHYLASLTLLTASTLIILFAKNLL